MNIFVICPSKSTTGGAECLHQFVDALRRIGCNAYISYKPDAGGGGSHEFFSDYNVPIKKEQDEKGNIIVLPENQTILTKQIHKARKAIFWLSIDNYLRRKRVSILQDIFQRFRSLQFTRARLSIIRDHLHISQSSYATSQLAKWRFTSFYIGDYLNQQFIEKAEKIVVRCEKKNQVAYNPKKGAKYIEKLKSTDTDIAFIPIINMSREEVVDLLSSSKVYLDLGHHPGKDRIPREAAVLGCCVLTSNRGSAGNAKDVPIPVEFKFSLGKSQLKKIPESIHSVFKNFESESRKFDEYRRKIKNERHEFIHLTGKWLKAIKAD